MSRMYDLHASRPTSGPNPAETFRINSQRGPRQINRARQILLIQIKARRRLLRLHAPDGSSAQI